MKIFGALILCGILIASISFSVSAQTDSTGGVKAEKVSEEAAAKLQQKILLSEKQTAGIEKILNEYLKDASKKNFDVAEKKIETLLDHRQKIKFSIVKKDWWETINQNIPRLKHD